MTAKNVSSSPSNVCVLFEDRNRLRASVTVNAESVTWDGECEGEIGYVRDGSWTPHNLSTEQTIALLQAAIDLLRNP